MIESGQYEQGEDHYYYYYYCYKKTDRILSGEKCVYLARKTSALGGTN